MANVTVKYNDFSKNNSIVEQITFDLLPNVTLILSQNDIANNTVTDSENSEQEQEQDNSVSSELTIAMVDKSTDQVEITGVLDDDILNALIRSLSIFRGQMQ